MRRINGDTRFGGGSRYGRPVRATAMRRSASVNPAGYRRGRPFQAFTPTDTVPARTAEMMESNTGLTHAQGGRHMPAQRPGILNSVLNAPVCDGGTVKSSVQFARSLCKTA